MVKHNTDFEPEEWNVKDKAASGFVYASGAQITKLVVQFLSVVILARMLEPEDFGLVAMVMPVYAFADMISDLGINQAVIQRPKITHAQVNAFFWLNITIGFTVASFIILLSPLVGWFYDDPRTVPMTICMAVIVFVGSLGMQHGAIMQRKMMFKQQAILNSVNAFSGLCVSVVLAYILDSYWALIVGMSASIFVATGGVWLCIGWRPSRPAWAEDAPDMLRYGLGIASANFINFLVQQSTNLTIGRAFGSSKLGLYDRSAKLLSAPLQQMIAPISSITVPMLYRMHDQPEMYKKTFLRTMSSITFMLAPGVLWAVFSSDFLINFLLGNKWQEAAPLFAALSLAALPQVINSSANWLFKTQGRSGAFAKYNLVNGVCFVTILISGVPMGLVFIASAIAAYQYIKSPFLWWYACKTGPVKSRDVLLNLKSHLTGIIATVCVLFLLKFVIPEWGIISVGGSLIVSYATMLGVMCLFQSGREALLRDYNFGLFMYGKILAKVARAKKTS